MPSGGPMTSVSLSRIIGLPLKQTIDCLERLVESGVASIEDDTKALVNRRMVRDESIRHKRAEGGEQGGEFGHLGGEFGKLGGRPRKAANTEAENPPLVPPLKPAPSSSSSSSTSVEEKKSSPSEKTKKGPTDPPKDFEITDEMREWAGSEGFDNGTIQRETAAMLDHFRGKGQRRSDWAATWRNWMRNSRKFGGAHGTDTRNGNSNARAAQAGAGIGPRPYTPKQ